MSWKVRSPSLCLHYLVLDETTTESPQSLLLPPLFALLLYLLSVYIIIPMLSRWRARRQASRQTFTQSITDRLPSSITNRIPSTDRLTSFFGARRSSVSSGASLLGDEELEDGFTGLDPEANNGEADSRRLSRDLERGFRDDSESDDEDSRGGRERPSRR